MSMCSCLILGLMSTSGELDGRSGEVEALRFGVEVSASPSRGKPYVMRIWFEYVVRHGIHVKGVNKDL